MEELIRKLQEVNRQAEKLTVAIKDLQKERDELQTRVSELEQTLTGKDAASRTNQTRLEAARLGQLTIDESDRQALRAQIDHYLQEIDLCLKRFGD